MISTFFVIGAALLAQSGPALYGAIPETVPTFHLEVDGAPIGPVALWSGGGWWVEGTDTLPAGGVGVQYLLDTPWQAVALERLPRGAEFKPETPVMRRDRLRKEWKANGYTFVSTPAGDAPVREIDLKLAKEAADAAAKVAARSAPENLSIGTVSSAESGTAPAPAAPPAWRGYLGHLIIIVLALIAGAVIVKVLIVGDDGGWERVG